MSAKKNKGFNSLVMLATLAMLIALEVVLSRLIAPINTQFSKISFAFVPVVVASYLYGIKGGAVVAGLGDVIGAVLFPSGEFFPGFTVTAILNGIIFGLFLGKKTDGKLNPFLRSFIPVMITQILGSFLLNTFWISYIYHSSFSALLATRLVQTVVMIAVEAVVIPVFTQSFSKIRSVKMLRN